MFYKSKSFYDIKIDIEILQTSSAHELHHMSFWLISEPTQIENAFINDIHAGLEIVLIYIHIDCCCHFII